MLAILSPFLARLPIRKVIFLLNKKRALFIRSAFPVGDDMNPIPNTIHKDYKSAKDEYQEWGMILLKMRISPKFNDMAPYNRWNVINRRKELLRQMAVLKTSGLGREMISPRVCRIVELTEFNQEDIYVDGSRRRWVYHA